MNRTRTRIAVAAVLPLALCASAAIAGEGNTLRVLQDSSSGTTSGNTLFVDQSGASNSLVTGPREELVDKFLDGDPLSEAGDLIRQGDNPANLATQRGENNSASIVMTGDGGELQILQDNSQAASRTGNTAQVAAVGNDTLGAVLQFGDNNTASLNLNGGLNQGARGLISQNGDNNQGTLTVAAGGSGEIIQNGNGNVTPLNVGPNTNVTVTQNGNGLQPAGITGVQIFSTNPGTISITQTGF